MSKKALLFLTLVGLSAAPCLPQSASDHGGTLIFTPSFVSDYMSRGVLLGGFSFQPAIEYSKGALSLGALANLPIADKIPGSSDPEIDIAASHTWDIVPSLFTVKRSISLYAYPAAKKDDGFFKATLEPSLSFEYAPKNMALSLNFYYDVTMRGGGLEFGFNRLIPI